MDIVIRGKNVDVSEVLRAAALEKLHKIDRFSNGFGRTEVEFSELRNPRIADNQLVEVLVHLKGHLLKAHASAPEPLVALDLVVDKIQHQVKKLKDKRVDRSHPRKSRVQSADNPVEEEEEPESARIVKTKQFTIKPMAPEEAALQMELLGHDFYFFTSSETGRAAVVYRRHDGDLGLIESAG
jgi:putative sigma-54 modulation protein